jgi:cysteine-rich repeat protein
MPLVGCGENGGGGGSAGSGGAAGVGGTGGPAAVCGDGLVEGTEACDDMGESAICDDDCTLAECGDSVVNVTAGEECDDGNTMDGDGCDATCLLPPAALFNGTYFYQALAGNFPVPAGYSWWGDLIADGVSEITGGTLSWNNGAGGIFSDAAPEISYTVDAARRMTWPGGGAFNLQGGIATDGSVATMSSIGETGWPGLAILVRRDGTFDLGSLNDTYHLSAFCTNLANEVAAWGTSTFDGFGGADEVISVNTNGTVVGPSPNTAQTYTVAADGTTTYTFGGGNLPIQGGILLGGDLVVLSGTTTPDAPCLFVLIRQSTAASASTLSGDYHIGAFVADAGAPPPNFSSFTGTGSSDGVGTVTTNTGGTINVDGAVGPFPAAMTNDPYTVAADGTLSVTVGGTTLKGAVSPTGDYAVLAGGTTLGSFPQLWFFVR